LGGRDQEDHGSRPDGANSSRDLHLQNNQRKIDWRYGSSSRVPALQMQSPKFKPQSHSKQKTKTDGIEAGVSYSKIHRIKLR
jgi:hypothetical protein